MNQFPSNSHGPSRDEPKRIEKVVVGEVIQRKKPLGRRFFDTVFGGDAHGVMGYVIMDVIVPTFRDLIVDTVTTAIERSVYGEARASSTRRGYRPTGGTGYVSYNRYASQQTPSIGQRREEPLRDPGSRRTRSPEYDEIILATRAEAQEVIERLYDLVSKYEQASVADLYELLGVSRRNYPDQTLGWTDMRGSKVHKVREGYLLELPEPQTIKA